MSSVLPILFNTDMVRAIPDGHKRATRRVVKGDVADIINSQYHKEHPKVPDKVLIEKLCRAPYETGDILYIRETWAFMCCLDCMEIADAPECTCMLGKTSTIHEDKDSASEGCYIYRADHPQPERITWHPSIYMPKAAARIWLKVTDVRVERLQEITEEQAIREGIRRLYDDLPDADYIDWTKRTGIYPKAKEDWGYKNYLWHGNFGAYGTGNKLSDAWKYQYSSYESAVGSFSSLWNTTVPLKDWNIYGWNANPWVWVIEFERCNKPAPCILNGMEPAEDKRPCIGYQKSKEDDEPCEMCKGCGVYAGGEME